MKYWILAAMAIILGLFYPWPKQPTGKRKPGMVTGMVSCGLTWGEAKTMYVKHNWRPWCFQYTKQYGWSRTFTVTDDLPKIDWRYTK